jgi:hypothetical protein
MTTTTALILNALLMAGIVGGLTAVIRLGLRLQERERSETLHPSQPLPLGLVRPEAGEPTLARAA